MDIYSIINSKDISHYCREINHQFNPLEMAYLIDANATMNILEKHKAFEEIIISQSDMEVPKRPWTPYYQSLHCFLKRYMEIQNKYIAMFYQDETNCVYSYKIWHASDTDYTEDDRLFFRFKECYQALKGDIAEMIEFYKKSNVDVTPIDIRVKKEWICCEGCDSGRYIILSIDYNNNPIELYDTYDIIDEADKDVFCAFEGMCPDIPVPFKKGDIVISVYRGSKAEKPVIIDWLPFEENNEDDTRIAEHLRANGDSSDLITGVYGVDENGNIWRDHGPSYLNLEYCDRDLLGEEKILLALSNYLKSEIPLHMFLQAYDILRGELDVAEKRYYTTGYVYEYLEKAGLSESKRKSID